MVKQFLCCLFCLTAVRAGYTQCISGDSVLIRIRQLKSAGLAPQQQLAELNRYASAAGLCSYQNDSTLSLLLLRIGILYYLDKDYPKAIDFTNRSIALVHAHAGEKQYNQLLLVRLYNNLQTFYDSAGLEKLKMRAIDSCVLISVKAQSGYDYSVQHIVTEIHFNFGNGDYYQCLNYANMGESITRKAKYNTGDLYIYIIWKINALIFLNRYTEAEQATDRAITECRKDGGRELGTLLNLKANIAAEQNKPADAIRFSTQSLAIDGRSGDYSKLYSTINNLGYKVYFLRLHQYDRALHYFKLSLRYAGSRDSVNTYDNIGNLFSRQNLFDSAFYYFGQGFRVIIPGMNADNFHRYPTDQILTNTDADYFINLLLDLGSAKLARFRSGGKPADIASAIGVYRFADKMIENIKSTQTEISSRLFWRTATRQLYENAIEACFLSHDPESAFYFFEKSRAVLLNDQLREQQMDDTAIARLSAVRRKIRLLENNLVYQPAGTVAATSLQRDLFTEKESLGQLTQSIKDDNPLYYQRFLDTASPGLQQARADLINSSHAQALVEFFQGDSAVYIFSLTATGALVQKISHSLFEASNDLFIGYLSNPARLNANFGGFVQSSAAFYRLLFPAALPDGRIIVSPDGKYFPIEALITATGKDRPEYFIEKHPVSYTYSARYLMNDFVRQKISGDGDFLGVAPVRFPASFQLASLTASDQSVSRIAAGFRSSRVLNAAAATKSRFLDQFSRYKIAQLYTHASDSGLLGEPVIYFADSLLYLSELIPEKKPYTQLMVLSACETGNGTNYKGEGVFSFNRAFAGLGIPSSLINLWSVDNASTYRLTELFYKYTLQGLPLDIALQKAKLDFITTASREKQLPFFWAAAIISGKTDPIKLDQNRPAAWLVAGALFSAIIVGWIILRKIQSGKKKGIN